MAEPAYNAGGLIGFDDTSTSTGNSSTPTEPSDSAPFGPPPPPPDNSGSTSTPTGGVNTTSEILQQLVEDIEESNVVNNIIESVPREIKPLKPVNLQNKYVPETNYESLSTISGLDEFFKQTEKINKNRITQNGDIKVTGNYFQNSEYFPKFNLDDVTVKDNIGINFILKVNEGTSTKVFTSKVFYDYLQDAYNRNIPFPALSRLATVVSINLNPILEKVKSFNSSEIKDGVRMNYNVFVDINRDDDDNVTYVINYDKLLQYVDWLITKPSPDYEKRIIPSQQISDYTLDKDYDEGL